MDVEDFESALIANFAESGFVASLPAADPSSKSFLAICKREGSGSASSVLLQHESRLAHGQSLDYMVTDCVSGIFRKQFGFTELTEMRREVGMAEFAWGTFLKLLSSAFRCQGGCSVAVELRPSEAPLAAQGQHMHLTLRFQLQAAALVTRVDLGTCTDGPSAALGIEAYLGELHTFIVGAVAAASGNESSCGLPRPTGHSQSPQLSKDALLLPAQSLGATLSIGGITASSGSSNSSRKTESTPGSAQSAKTAVPKKRAGSLVDPHARRVRSAGANPFQLSRSEH